MASSSSSWDSYSGICFATTSSFVQEVGDHSLTAALRRVVWGDVVREEGTKAATPVKPDARRNAVILADKFILSTLLLYECVFVFVRNEYPSR